MMYTTHDQYPQLLTGAHRKPAPLVEAPALIWHLGFWKPLPKDGFVVFPGKRAEEVDKYIIDVLKKLRTRVPGVTNISFPGQEPPKSKGSEEGHSVKKIYSLFAIDVDSDGKEVGISGQRSAASGAVTLKFDWRGLVVRLHFQLHAEYLTLSISLSAGSPPSNTTTLADEFGLTIASQVRGSFAVLLKYLNDEVQTRDKYSDIHNCLYYTIWEQFYSQILYLDPGTRENPSSIDKLGKVFADFRGIVVDASTTKQSDFFEPPLSPTKPGMRAARPHRLDNPLPIIKTLWPFLTSEARIDYRQYEFTISKMLLGRALYITAMGAQPTQSTQLAESNERFPVLYFFYSAIPNRWQLGRLVDRINDLGTVRLAAIMYLQDLHAADYKLREIELRVAETIRAVHELAMQTTPKHSSEADEARDRDAPESAAIDGETKPKADFTQDIIRSLGAAVRERVVELSGFSGDELGEFIKELVGAENPSVSGAEDIAQTRQQAIERLASQMHARSLFKAKYGSTALKVFIERAVGGGSEPDKTHAASGPDFVLNLAILVYEYILGENGIGSEAAGELIKALMKNDTKRRETPKSYRLPHWVSIFSQRMLRGDRSANEAGEKAGRLAKETRSRRARKKLATALGGVQRRFANIEKYMNEISTTGKGAGDYGDIQYRIERSRYYIKQFSESVKWLRVVRVEGYQPYDTFVFRRFGRAFEFIEMLGARVRDVNGDIASLFRYYMAQNAAAVERGIGDQAQALVDLETGTRQILDSVDGLQRGAEVALIGALLPYYLGSSIEHIFGSSLLISVVWGVTFLVCATVALIKWNEYWSLGGRIGHVFRWLWRMRTVVATGVAVFSLVVAALLTTLHLAPGDVAHKVWDLVVKMWQYRISG